MPGAASRRKSFTLPNGFCLSLSSCQDSFFPLQRTAHTTNSHVYELGYLLVRPPCGIVGTLTRGTLMVLLGENGPPVTESLGWSRYVHAIKQTALYSDRLTQVDYAKRRTQERFVSRILCFGLCLYVCVFACHKRFSCKKKKNLVECCKHFALLACLQTSLGDCFLTHG